jgi:hypothetical protein
MTSMQAAKDAVAFYGVEILPRLRSMDPSLRSDVLKHADALS